MINNILSDFRAKDTDKFYFESSSDKLNYVSSELKKLENKIFQTPFSDKLKNLKEKIKEISNSISLEERTKRQLLSEIEEFSIPEEDEEKKKEEIKQMEVELKILENQKSDLKLKKDEIKEKIERMGVNTDFIKQLNLSEELGEIVRIEKEIMVKEKKINSMNLSIKNMEDRHFKLSFAYQAMCNEIKEVDVQSDLQGVRTAKDINNEIIATNVKIEASKNLGKEVDLQKKVNKLKKDKQFKEEILDEYKNKINKMLSFIKKRIEKREKIKNEISVAACNNFEQLTQIKGYKGSLIFNHEDKTLELVMKVEDTKTGGSRSTLSGGERSFAGVCFLLSLWSSISCPVKILDEFDVYMDNLNRKFTIKIILDYFRKSKGQLILITPLDTQYLNSSVCDVVTLQAPRTES